MRVTTVVAALAIGLSSFGVAAPTPAPGGTATLNGFDGSESALWKRVRTFSFESTSLWSTELTGAVSLLKTTVLTMGLTRREECGWYGDRTHQPAAC